MKSRFDVKGKILYRLWGKELDEIKRKVMKKLWKEELKHRRKKGEIQGCWEKIAEIKQRKTQESQRKYDSSKK